MSKFFNIHSFERPSRRSQKNDAAVMEAYGFEKNLSESEIVARLMKLYKDFTDK